MFQVPGLGVALNLGTRNLGTLEPWNLGTK